MDVLTSLSEKRQTPPPSRVRITNMVEFIILCSLVCVCVHVSITWDGFILNRSLKYLDKLPEVLRKPLFDCLPCMGGIYTLTISIVTERELNAWFFLCILAVVGLNTLIQLFLRLIEAIENLETINDEGTGGAIEEKGMGER